MTAPRGYLVGEGRGNLAIATLDTVNHKVAGAGQVWYLPKVREKASMYAGCERCPLRRVSGCGACYVNPVATNGPWVGATSGRYPFATPADVVDCAPWWRIGAAGDPLAPGLAATSTGLVAACQNSGRAWTAYTSRWASSRALHARPWAMASVHNPAMYETAKRLGWRTFRSRLPDEPLLSGEVQCPGYCPGCPVRCDGLSSGGPDVSVIIHGPPNKVRAYVNWRKAGER